jgi:hypothetical protein
MLTHTFLFGMVPGQASNADRDRNLFEDEEGPWGGNLLLPDEEPVEPVSSGLLAFPPLNPPGKSNPSSSIGSSSSDSSLLSGTESSLSSSSNSAFSGRDEVFLCSESSSDSSRSSSSISL